MPRDLRTFCFLLPPQYAYHYPVWKVSFIPRPFAMPYFGRVGCCMGSTNPESPQGYRTNTGVPCIPGNRLHDSFDLWPIEVTVRDNPLAHAQQPSGIPSYSIPNKVSEFLLISFYFFKKSIYIPAFYLTKPPQERKTNIRHNEIVEHCIIAYIKAVKNILKLH